MGYCMDQIESSFFIDKKDFQACLEAIQKLDPWKDGQGGHYSKGGREDAWFAWVDNKFSKRDNLVDCLRDWRWWTDLDRDGNISEIFFEGEKLGDDRTLLDTIAPFVKEGSFIEMRGEDGAMWKWEFLEGRCGERDGRVVYD